MKTAIILFLFFLSSCSSILCGELTGEWKQMLEKASAVFPELKVENIPCEFYYIDIFISSEKIDTSEIHSLHKYLYDHKSRIGWQVLQVYDSKQQYLFSHRYNNDMFIQTGD